jgi:branched-chain amino acid transport system permease protein
VFNVLISGILLGGIYALVALGLNLIFGVIEVVNFAHGELVMLGIYGAYLGFHAFGISPYLSVFVIAPAMFVIGMAIQKLIIEPLLDEPNMQIFATFGLVLVLQSLVTAITEGQAKSVRTGISSSTIDIGAIVSVPRLIILVLAIAITIGLNAYLRRTVAGTAIRGISQDRSTATLMGIDVKRTYLFTFGLSAALAGIAGVLIAPIYTATPTIGFSFILPAFAVVILGGLGSIPGSLLGGLIVGLVESFAGYYISPDLKQAIWFALFLVVLVIRPAGLLGKLGPDGRALVR